MLAVAVDINSVGNTAKYSENPALFVRPSASSANMLQNGLKLTNSGLIWRKNGPSRLYSSVCLHCQAKGQASKGSRICQSMKRDYSSNVDRPRKSHPIRNTLVLLGATTGAVVGYAKFDSDFRKQIEENSPAFNEFIKIVTQEERSYQESYNVISNYVSSLYGDLFGESAPVELPKKPSLPPTPKPVQSKIDAKSPSKPGYDETSKNVVQAPPSPPITAKPPVDKPKTVVVIGNIEDEIRQAASGAIVSLRNASQAVKSYGEEVGKILDSDVVNRDNGAWASIRSKTANKEKLVSAAERAVAEATDKLSQVRASVDSSSASQEERNRINRILSAATLEVESARRELEAQKQRGAVTDRYWSRVEDARRHFQEEIQALFPNANISDRKLELNGTDLDLFLLHVFKHVVFYQRELARLESIGEQQVRQALERSGESVGEQLIQTRVKQAVEKERRRLEEDLQRKLLVARSEQEKEVGTQLKRQLETAQDHLNDVLTAKETDLNRRVARKLDERDNAEREAYETKLAKMLSQLKALELVLGDRIEADRNAHQAHVLFSACQSLFRALRSGVAGSHWSQQLRPLNPEISAVSNAVGGSDQLVATVLASIPPQAKTRGVYPETALRERFLRVEQVARQVALVPETGGSLLRYLLSYIQSSLLFPSPAIPTKEVKDEAVDVSKLDTYDLLQRARYWVDRGDLKMSLRYMNLLRGASRAVANQWMDEARIYLETQLVVHTLMAHAAATGMLYL